MASQACLASPVSSWPGLSEARAADREKGAKAAVKTKMDKRFILSYSVKSGWGLEEGFKGRLKFQTALGLLEFRH